MQQYNDMWPTEQKNLNIENIIISKKYMCLIKTFNYKAWIKKTIYQWIHLFMETICFMFVSNGCLNNDVVE